MRSYYDAITGGFTRDGFIKSLEKMRKQGIDLRKYAILFVNIKGFKAVNELFGSDAGDELLRVVYLKVSNSALAPLVSSRKESDHFVFLVEQNDIDYDNLRSLLEFRWKFQAQEVAIHCRCGIYNIDNNDREIAGMIDRAKLAKEHITDEFVEPYCVFTSSMRANYVDQMVVLSTFEDALEHGAFDVYYQPLISAKTLKVAAAEALVRWNSAEHGLLAPAQFLPILEQYGYITKLDAYVLGQAKNFQLQRLQQGLPCVPISTNLSRMDFFDQKLLKGISSNLKQNEALKGLINLEITESISHEGNKVSKIDFIEAIHNAGAKILLDDFGVGYSVFDMIDNYNLDIIKIDMSFVKKITTESKAKVIINTIIYMSHNLGMEVVAEGVETKEELDLLIALGCDYIQGYYFAKPMPQQEFEAYLAEHL